MQTYVQTVFIDDKKWHGGCEKFTRVANIDGRLLSVTSQYPDLHVGFGQVGDGFRHTLL